MTTSATGSQNQTTSSALQEFQGCAQELQQQIDLITQIHANNQELYQKNEQNFKDQENRMHVLERRFSKIEENNDRLKIVFTVITVTFLVILGGTLGYKYWPR